MKIKLAIAALATLAGGLSLGWAHEASAQGDDMPKWSQTPCEYEDSTNCFWDAGEQGNSKGHSFFAIKVGDSTCLAFWDDRYARHHNRCIVGEGMHD
jgi:hypothetical protein